MLWSGVRDRESGSVRKAAVEKIREPTHNLIRYVRRDSNCVPLDYKHRAFTIRLLFLYLYCQGSDPSQSLFVRFTVSTFKVMEHWRAVVSKTAISLGSIKAGKFLINPAAVVTFSVLRLCRGVEIGIRIKWNAMERSIML